jgi:prophage regulatory protein
MRTNNPQYSVVPPTKFLRLNHLKELLGVSGSSIWAWVKKGKFPKPIKLSENTTAWNAVDVEAWSQSRIDASRVSQGDSHE